MRTAVSGSLRHIVWLQRFDGHTETESTSLSKPILWIRMQQLYLMGFLTFSVVAFYLRRHSFLAVHPVQSFFLWGWRLVYVLGETVHVLRAPGHVASFTDQRPPRCLLLFTWAQAKLNTSHADGNILSRVWILPWAKLWVCCPPWKHWCQFCSLGSQQMKRCHTTARSWV